MIPPDIFGYAATFLSTIMLIPQVVQTWKTKQTKDLSFITLVLFLLACVLWIIYGIEKEAFPIIITNIVVGICNLILIILKLTNKKTT